MTEIRAKDRLFVALTLPLTVAALYLYAWRGEAAKELESAERRRASLVAEEDFESQLAKARRERKSAEEELAAERKIPMPEAAVKANPADGETEREAAVLNVFREAGLRVAASEPAGDAGKNRDMLQAAGCRPRPMTRRYVLEGGYAQTVKALSVFAERKMAVITEKADMPEAGHWTLEITL